MNPASLDQFFDETRDQFVQLSDRIWDLAELRYEEYGSASHHTDMLRAEGFTVTTGIAGMPTAFCAEAGQGGPVIALLGEYDALPGMSQQDGVASQTPLACSANGHGCGHHLLGAGAHWAAVALKRFLEHSRMPGRIRFFGCPAEEGGSGKTFMARAGVFDGLDAALTWHPDYETGVMTGVTLSNIQVSFRFKGVASHAAISPHLGRSALDAVELMNVGVNYMREHMPSDARIHYAISDAGGASPNVVQANAAVLYLIRTPTNGATQQLYERVHDIARGAALMTGCSVEAVVEKACSNLVFNRTLADVMQACVLQTELPHYTEAEIAAAYAMQQTFSADERADMLRSYGMGPNGNPPAIAGLIPYAPDNCRQGFASSDVGDVSWITPTVQCMSTCYAYGTAFHTWQMVAQGKSPLAHKGLEVAAKVLARTAIELFLKPDRLIDAKAELIARGGGPAYRSPIPEGVEPPLKSIAAGHASHCAQCTTE